MAFLICDFLFNFAFLSTSEKLSHLQRNRKKISESNNEAPAKRKQNEIKKTKVKKKSEREREKKISSCNFHFNFFPKAKADGSNITSASRFVSLSPPIIALHPKSQIPTPHANKHISHLNKRKLFSSLIFSFLIYISFLQLCLSFAS